jgi:transcription initiation factor TFIID subunit 7
MDDDDTNFSPKASTSSIPAISTRPTRRIRKQRINLADEQEEAPPRQKGRAGAVKYTDASNIMGDGNSGYGWDREIDSDPDEPLNFEEQFILRVPPAMAPALRELVEKRSLPPDVWFKFKDSRRAVFHMGNKLYGAKLVDLPALVESQKMTGLGGASVKVADISQMLLVEEEIADEAEVTKDQAFNIEDFIFPHGLTPPLKHVRKRRFRKRVNKRVSPFVSPSRITN